MEYQLSWLIENRIILVKFVGVMDSKAMQAYLEESFAMRDQANEANGVNGPLVHTITDSLDVTGSKLGLSDIRSMMTQLRDQKVGWSIFVSDKMIDRLFASIGHQFVGVRHREFATMEEGFEFLENNDPTLGAIPRLQTENAG